jgi:HSP20 family protein
MGSFTRRIRLSDVADAEKISAAYDSGVLRVTVPLQERALPRKIEVSAGAQAAVEA